MHATVAHRAVILGPLAANTNSTICQRMLPRRVMLTPAKGDAAVSNAVVGIRCGMHGEHGAGGCSKVPQGLHRNPPRRAATD